MEVKWDNIGLVLNSLTGRQMRLVMDTLAIVIQNKVVIDKVDFMDAVKLGLSWPSKVE